MRAVADAGGECPAVGASYVRRRVNSLLWDPSRGRYSAYLYGGRLMDMQAPVTDNIGQAMAMIWGVASEPMVSSVLSRTGYIRGMVPDLYPLMAGMKVEAALTGAPMMQTLWAMAAVMDRARNLCWQPSLRCAGFMRQSPRAALHHGSPCW